MDNSNSGVDASTRLVKDGEGTTSALALSDDVVRVRVQNDNSTGTFLVENDGGSSALAVDTTNMRATCGATGQYIHTQYAEFGIGNATAFVVNTHHAIPFNNLYSTANVTYPPAFGTSTEPATTFTTSEGNGTRASDIVPCIWYTPEHLVIDSVTSIEGADSATGDVTRMHLYSFEFTSGSTSCLTSGTLLAHNSDVTNAGSEQPYLTTWTIDSSDVAATKAIVAFFRSDSVNSDYSINIRVKYHLY